MRDGEERNDSKLAWSRRRDVVQVTIQRPNVRNALDGDTMRAFDGVITRLEAEETVRGVILTGAGHDAFCAGGDLRDLQQLTTPDLGANMSRHMHGLLQRYERLPQVTISVLNGYALGGGAELALASDYVICEAHAFMAFKQGRMGLITGWGGARRLLEKVGYTAALDFVTTGRRISSKFALDAGLVTQIVETGEGIRAAETIIRETESTPLSALRAFKTLLRSVDAVKNSECDRMEADLFETVWGSPEHWAAVQRFLQRRRPHQ